MKGKVEKHRVNVYKAGSCDIVSMQEVFIMIFILILSSSGSILAPIKYTIIDLIIGYSLKLKFECFKLFRIT